MMRVNGHSNAAIQVLSSALVILIMRSVTARETALPLAD
jgi:hypothetical protein